MRRIASMVAVSLLAFAGAVAAQVTYSDRPPPPPPPPQYAYPGQPPPDYPAGNRTVSCGSPQYRLLRCGVPGYWRGARIVQQTSKSACVEGRTWGFDRGSIWVDKGCGGVFAPAGYGGWRPGPRWNRDFVVSCGSPQYQRYFCQVDIGGRGHVVLQRQVSDTRCIEGRNWGWNRAGIWVDKGCGAQFLVTRRW